MIEVSSLSKRYGNHLAVKDANFSIKKGEVVGFLGPNGAGKSTIMNILTGYLSLTQGKVEIDGFDIMTDPELAKKRIGYLPEIPPLYLDMTVREYLYFIYDLKKVKFPKEPHIDEIIRLVRIAEVEERLIKNLSKGYRQRVGIAGALVGNPDVLILDEPTVGLDPKQIIEVRNLLRSLGKNHTVILSTHILPEVQAICDRIIIINEGKIIADEKTAKLNQALGQNNRFRVKIAGPAKEVSNLLKGIHGVTRVTQDGARDGDAFNFIIEYSGAIDIRKMMFRALADKGWPIMAMEGVEITLEDLFIKLTSKEGELK